MQKDSGRRSQGRKRSRVQSYHGEPLNRADGPQARNARNAPNAKSAPALPPPPPAPAAPPARVVAMEAPAPEPLAVPPLRSEVRRSNKQRELFARFVDAQGSRAVSDAYDALVASGYALPDEQEHWLLLLEHRDEAVVRQALAALERLWAGQEARRKPLVVQRLRRLEEYAEDAETRDLAAALRRRLG